MTPSGPISSSESATAGPHRTAVLWCNLGTPDAPTVPAVRRYLAEFLADRRVVEIPPVLWWFVLHGLVLRTRPQASAAKYATIWTPDGSPLAVWTARQATMLRGWLGEAGHALTVRHAMRYGSPSIPAQLDALREAGATRILVLPAYPQYAGSSTGSVFDAVTAWGRQQRAVPEFRFVHRFHDDAGYIGALAERVQAHWRAQGRGHLLLSFHGVPARTVALGDPYRGECLETARLLAARLQLAEDAWTVTFQSRFGRSRWIEPYTQPTVEAMARSGTRRLDVMCPGFTGDCLETLEEINMEVRAAFIDNGGAEFHYIPALNDSPAWIRALSDIAQRHLAGWETQRPRAAEPPEPALEHERVTRSLVRR